MKKAESMNIEPYNLILLTKLTPLPLSALCENGKALI